MTNEELVNLINQVRTGVTSNPVTKIDETIPLPTGSKTLIGFLGALFTGVFTAVSADPNILTTVISDWKSSLASVLVLAFTALMGAGGISKWQRQIMLSQQAVEVLQQVLQKLQAEGNRE